MKHFFVSIAEYSESTGEMSNTMYDSFKEADILALVNDFFKEETAAGHPVPGHDFKSFAELHSVFCADEQGDRSYCISAKATDVDSYEAYTLSKLHDFGPGKPKEATFAKTFLDELNHQPFDGKKFAEALCSEHPTLQQHFFKLVKACILARAENSAYSSDERNEGSVRLCRELAPLMGKYGLPIR